MIPRTIHYCWFGNNPKTLFVEKCIDSWKKYCKDYKIIEWNENNFNISIAPLYVKQAYSVKKYAFVSDYVRLWALINYGGLYFDTDIEIIKQLDQFLSLNAFACFENNSQIQTGILACQNNHPIFKEFIKEYDKIEFINKDGTFDYTTNVKRISDISMKFGFTPNGKLQKFYDFTIYPQNYFCPDHEKLNDELYMKDTFAIHWFAGSWKSLKTKKREKSFWWKNIIVPLSKYYNKSNSKLIFYLKKIIWKYIIND